MRFRVELSKEAQKQLGRFPRDVRERIERAVDEFDKKVGAYRIVFRKYPERGALEISAILVRSKGTYR